jgi:outer membrane lipoprotein-sorting protein
MKRNIITLGLLLSLFAVCLSGFAQDATATKILNESKAKFDKLQDFSADFVYSLENPSNSNTNVTEKGILHYSKGKYTVILEGQEIFCDGKTIWIHIPEDEEVTILDSDSEEGFSIEKIFSLYEEGSKARYDGAQTIEGRPMHKIYIAATDKNLEFNQARMWINRSTNLLEKAVITNRRQINTIFEFSNIKTNQGLPPSTFVFDTANFKGDVYDEREG